MLRRMVLAAAIGVLASGPVRADDKIRAAQLAFLSEIAPHSCSDFEENISSHAAWMVNHDIRHADLFKISMFGPKIMSALQDFEQSISINGVENTCSSMYKLLGPSGAGLVKPAGG